MELTLVLVIVVLLGLLGNRWRDDEAATLKELSERHQLELGDFRLTGPGLEIFLTTEPHGRTSLRYLNYSAQLDGCPAGLALSREGLDSALKHQSGKREITVGDPDLDDLAWIECADRDAALAYLTPERRTLFLELLWDMPHARISDGRLHGRVLYLKSTLLAVLANCQRVNRPETAAPRVGSGYVNHAYRTYHARRAFLLAFLVASPTLSRLQEGDRTSPYFFLWCLPGLAALLFLWPAVGLVLNWPDSVQRLRHSLRLAQWAGVLIGLAFLGLFGYLGGATQPAALAFLALAILTLGSLWWWFLASWRRALTRVRVGDRP